MSLVRLRPEAPRCRSSGAVCGRSSSGRARPCQGRGSEFEPRRPLQKSPPIWVVIFLRAPRRSPSCQPAPSRCRGRQSGHFLETASLLPPQAALRRFPRRPLQKSPPIWVVIFLRAPRRSPSCQPAPSRCRGRQSGHFLETASLLPPQAALRRFPRRPLQKSPPIWVVIFLRAPRRSPSCQPAPSRCRGRQSGHFLETASLLPPQAALRRFPRRRGLPDGQDTRWWSACPARRCAAVRGT